MVIFRHVANKVSLGTQRTCALNMRPIYETQYGNIYSYRGVKHVICPQYFGLITRYKFFGYFSHYQ
jgi:hypothetical protein